MLKLNIINANGLSKHCGKRLNNETFKIIIIKKKHGCGHRSLRTQEKLAKFRSLMTAPHCSGSSLKYRDIAAPNIQVPGRCHMYWLSS